MRDLFKLIWTRHGRIITVLMLIALMYGFAINPYLLPNTYDNIVYYMGAKSLAESGAYVFNGYYVADWGPGFPLLLSIPMVLGMDSVVVAKLVVLASVLASVIFIYRCFQREKRTFPVVNCLIVGFLSTAFLMGTRLMSEWLFILVSMVFFELLYVLNTKRKYSIAIVVGLLLGFSSLVRWIGVQIVAYQTVAQRR